MKKPLALLLISTLGSLMAFGGDVAVLKNLGFSADGKYFMFGQYGIDGQTKNPYAEIFTVDVAKNAFVPGGVSKGRYPVAISIGDDGQKALYAQLEKVDRIRKSLKLDFLTQGRPIYFRVVSEQNPAQADSLKVLDYQTGREYGLELTETSRSSGDKKTSGAFQISLEIRDKGGNVLGTYKVGSPDFYREGVKNYTISQILLTPKEKGAVIVVEREEDDGLGGINIRYMVETLTF